MGRQKFFHLFVEPLIHFIMLTGGTMPVPTAAGDGLYGAAFTTTINNGSERTTAAIHDILNGLFMDLAAFGLHKVPYIAARIFGRFFESHS